MKNGQKSFIRKLEPKEDLTKSPQKDEMVKFLGEIHRCLLGKDNESILRRLESIYVPDKKECKDIYAWLSYNVEENRKNLIRLTEMYREANMKNNIVLVAILIVFCFGLILYLWS